MPFSWRFSKVLAFGLLAGAAADAQPTLPLDSCSLLAPPPQVGPVSRPAIAFPAADHRFLHSSIHLQGLRARSKWAGGLIHRMPVSTGFDGFTSAVVVDNPDPVDFLTVRIDYFDHNGVLVGTSLPPPIPPEGFHTEAATPLASSLGVGSARVRALTGKGVLGAVLLHTVCAGGICDPDRPLSLNHRPPGASSAQQLQVVQEKTELWWGPLPLTLTSGNNFFNHQAPFFWVVNPNNAPNAIRVDLVFFDRATGLSTPVAWRSLVLPPFGTLLEKSGPHLTGPPGLWDDFQARYATLGTGDFDVLVHVTSDSGLPILGDGVMTSFVQNVRFRMVSHMLANTPSSLLTDPDFSEIPGGIIQTYIGLMNAGTAASSVRVEYFNRSGGAIGSSSFFLAPDQSVRIVPGTFGYPLVASGFGWARITGCEGDRLVGWSVREIVQVPGGPEQHHKAFGETLDGNNGQEPGTGFVVTDANGQSWLRKVAPLTRITPAFAWPGYTTFLNPWAANTGTYQLRFDNAVGTECAAATFAGIPWGMTSTTYDDDLQPPPLACVGTVSGRVDVGGRPIQGMSILGDPYDEYGIPDFALPAF